MSERAAYIVFLWSICTIVFLPMALDYFRIETMVLGYKWDRIRRNG